MIVRLHNLSARRPVLADAPAVAELMHLCDYSTIASVDAAADDVRKRWQAPDFYLSHDAWVIVTHKGLVVGYADVRRAAATPAADSAAFLTTICVHPEYRERGLETLLIWLTEERAHQFLSAEPALRQAILSTTLSGLDAYARAIFQREGYTRAHSVWRVTIAMDEMPLSSFEPNRLTVDLVLDVDNLLGTKPHPPRTGIYSAHQYEVYEKILRAAPGLEAEPILDMQYAGA